MKSIRRLYFYLVAFISIEVVLWGLILLIRSMLDNIVSGTVDDLAQALALILVGVPIFLVHWLWAQRASAREEEEKEATLRAVFLYAILIGTLVPVVQNLLAFINRSFLGAARLSTVRAFIGGSQTLTDNIVAIIMNLIVAAYFWSVLRAEWTTLKDRENFSEVRRLYRYIWMLYGLLMMVIGAQQVLRFLLYIPGNVLGELGREVMVNGIALLAIGTPVWIYSWRVIQDSLSDPAEMGSNLRLGILYILALGGVITVVTVTFTIVNELLLILFGQASTLNEFLSEIRGPLSVGIPLGVLWAYYGYWLGRHIESTGDRIREAGMKRLYYYILSFIGLTVAFVGVGTLFAFIINLTTSRGLFVLGSSDRSMLASSISSLLIGLPLWLVNWRPMQAGALAQGEMGDHARRSVIRKFYLYLALFGSVIGGMVTAVGLVYLLLSTALSGDVGSNFVKELLNLVQLLFLFVVVLLYHSNVLRRDGTSISDALAEKQSTFSVLIVDSGDGFVDTVKAALAKSGAKVQATVTTLDKKPEGDFGAVILGGSLAVDAPAWIKSFGGSRIIVQNDANDLVWADDAAQAAESVQRLAEGQQIQKKKPTRSAWTYVVYVFAALFALQLLFMLLALAISLIAGF
ncbi:MAG: hypothetical protein C3F07_04280 [Anaerolineales bacterium]|nr:hypothetical protein [Anaerolineae bacterium]PWB76042.1 MAG: hypothetical protein C3F07_04280 [Anaerolineales bacterium]